MKTLNLVNIATNIAIVISGDTNSEMHRNVCAKGAEIGRTSFIKLLTGKTKEACGYVLKEIDTLPKASENRGLVDVTESLRHLMAELKAIGVETEFKQDTTACYATLKVEEGRIQVTPLKKDGLFNVMFFPKKGLDADAIKPRFEVVKERVQYAKIRNMQEHEIVHGLK